MWKQLKALSWHGMEDYYMRSNATLLMCLSHIVQSHNGQLLGVYHWLSLATSIVSWPQYTLNKLDTLSNGTYMVRNPLACDLNTTLWFLNCWTLYPTIIFRILKDVEWCILYSLYRTHAWRVNQNECKIHSILLCTLCRKSIWVLKKG